MITIDLDKVSSVPVYIQIYKKIRSDIEQGIIKKGEKLPSKRTLALNLGVSIITVEGAYDQLKAEGYIRSEAKRGYFAEDVKASVKPEKQSVVFSESEKASVSLEENQMFPFAVWAKLMREVLSSRQDDLLTKPSFEGVFELRQAIAEHLRNFRNINVSPNQIIIGAGTEYLYMLMNLLFGNNYVFAVENPGYEKIADIYMQYGIKCERIPVLDDGIDVDYLRSIKADVIHISPSHHFPTGVITSIGKRYALLEWASQSPDRYIIEDDYDSEFRLSGKPVPALCNIDVMDKVIYMNTFSKSLVSTIRISYMVLPMSLLNKFKQKFSFYSCPVSTFEQYTLEKFIKDGYFEKHINRMRTYYRSRRQELFQRMKEYEIFNGAVISGENSGLHCVVSFDTLLSDDELYKEVKHLGFRIEKMQKYYCDKADNNLHKLIFFY